MPLESSSEYASCTKVVVPTNLTSKPDQDIICIMERLKKADTQEQTYKILSEFKQQILAENKANFYMPQCTVNEKKTHVQLNDRQLVFQNDNHDTAIRHFKDVLSFKLDQLEENCINSIKPL